MTGSSVLHHPHEKLLLPEAAHGIAAADDDDGRLPASMQSESFANNCNCLLQNVNIQAANQADRTLLEHFTEGNIMSVCNASAWQANL